DLYEMLERSVNNSFYPVATYRATATKPFFVVAQRPLIRPARARAGSESAQAAIAVSGGCSMSDPADDTPEFGDPRINGLLATARRLIERRLPILLFGETGVGKEVFARALHRVSPLAEGEFAVVDCAALPESVIDDLLMCAGGG